MSPCAYSAAPGTAHGHASGRACHAPARTAVGTTMSDDGAALETQDRKSVTLS